VLGPENPNTLASQANLAAILNREGRHAEAEKIAAETFEVQLRVLGPEHSDTLDTLKQLGRAMAYGDRYAEASRLFQAVIERQTNSPTQGNRWSAWYAFASVAIAANHPDDALRYLREAIHRGYTGAAGLMADEDLKDLRHNPQFQDLVATLRIPPKRGT
jgi:tetratricopeptide (TPR) repeat protein